MGIIAPYKFTARDAVTRAQEILAQRYRGAEFCIAAGSIVRGQGTIRSDLDLIVVFQRIDHAFRESFTFREMPVEAFVHDHETIQAFINEDYEDGQASIMNMIVTGTVLPQETGTSRKLKEYSKSLLENGPQPLSREQEQTLRYFISDLIDDLQGERTPPEQRAIFYKLYPQIGELALRRAGKFSSTGKHLARNLEEHCPMIFNTLENLMIQIHNRPVTPAQIKALKGIVEDLGGFLFDGYRRDAPKEKRSKPIWLEPTQ